MPCSCLWTTICSCNAWMFLPITAALLALAVQAFGLPISWRKADLHREVSWIGWTFNFSSGQVKLQPSKREKLLKLIQEMLDKPKTSRKHIERFVGLALWITQLFPSMRAFLHHLYVDLYKATHTSYSVDPGFWLTTISCLNENLQFTTRPIGTAIPQGSKLLSIRHQPVSNSEDVRTCRLSEKRIWVRVMDPQTISKDSQRILKMYQSWLQYSTPVVSMNPKPSWNGEAAADACAAGDSCQIGAFLKFANGDMKWFSEQWTYTDFHELDIPVSMDMQKEISSYETLAQIGLLFTLNQILPAQRLSLSHFAVKVTTQQQNPLQIHFSALKYHCCFFLLSVIVNAQMDVTHIPGYYNGIGGHHFSNGHFSTPAIGASSIRSHPNRCASNLVSHSRDHCFFPRDFPFRCQYFNHTNIWGISWRDSSPG